MIALLKKHKVFNLIFTFLVSCIITKTTLDFFGIELTPYKFFAWILAGATCVLIIKAQTQTTLRVKIIGSVYSALIAATFIVGSKIDFSQMPYFIEFNLKDILYFLVFFIVFYVLFNNFIKFTEHREIKFSSAADTRVTFKQGLLIWGVIIILWLPYLLIYYPGNISPDSYSSISQAYGWESLNNHHPVLFTAFISLFMHIGDLVGDINFAIATFSFAQMCVLAAIFSYSVCWLKRKGAPRFVTVICAVFFALNPVIAMYSITMWKDVLFGGYLLLFVLLIYDVIKSKGQLLCSASGIVRATSISLLVAFWRNNGVYILIVTFAVLAIIFYKNYKRLIPLFAAVLCVIFVVQGPVYDCLGIKKSSFAESVGIPLQQIGYSVKCGGEVDEESKEYLDKLVPEGNIGELYQPTSPDHIKFNAGFDDEFLNENKFGFIKVWFRMLPSNFEYYVKAYLMQTDGYYYLGQTNWVVRKGVYSSNPAVAERGIHNTDVLGKILSVDVRAKTDHMFSNLYSASLFGSVFSIATMVWVTFLCVAVLIAKRRYELTITLLPLIALWLTMMIAAPTFCEFRYMFSFHLCLPLVIFMLFAPEADKRKNIPSITEIDTK